MTHQNPFTHQPAASYPTSVSAAGILKRSKLPDRHLNANYVRKELPRFDKALRSMASILDAGGLAVLIGHRGTGKTQMATFYAKSLANRLKGETANDTPIMYGTAAEVLGAIRAESNESGRIPRSYERARLLILDEISVRSRTEWESNTLTLLIDKRYGANLPTLLIGNILPKELIDLLGRSIMDRARDGGGVINCDWDSRRGAKT